MTEASLTRAQARAVDRIALEHFGLSGLVLMENAGLNAALCLLPVEGEVCVACGGGNNGGDGYVLARHLAIRGVEVACFATHPPERMGGDALVNRGIVEAMGLEVVDLNGTDATGRFDAAALCVDALLGTGFQGEVREPAASVIDQLNSVATPVVAIDLPSGLDADTGAPAGSTVRAARTLTFVAPKVGFAAPGARAHTGPVTVLSIGAPPSALERALGEA